MKNKIKDKPLSQLEAAIQSEIERINRMHNKMNNLNNNIIKYNKNIDKPILSESPKINNEINRLSTIIDEKDHEICKLKSKVQLNNESDFCSNSRQNKIVEKSNIENLLDEKIVKINEKYLDEIKKLNYDKNKLKEKYKNSFDDIHCWIYEND